jgi:hypothetical protein
VALLLAGAVAPGCPVLDDDDDDDESDEGGGGAAGARDGPAEADAHAPHHGAKGKDKDAPADEGRAAAAGVALALPPPTGPVVPSLFEVKGGKAPLYLFGTIHLAVTAADELPPIVWERLDGAAIAMFEADVRKVDMMATAARATLPDEESLERKLPPVEWKKLVEQAKGVLPEMALRRLQPWFVVTALETSLFPPTTPMDQVLLERAAKSGKKLGFFETWEEQLDLIAKGLTVDDLVELVDERERFIDESRRLVLAYRAGDLAAAADIIYEVDAPKKHPAQLELLIFGRNARWAPVLERLLAEGKGPVFVAVGCGHLVGDKGLVALLRAAGHEVVRLGAAEDAGTAAAAKAAPKGKDKDKGRDMGTGKGGRTGSGAGKAPAPAPAGAVAP